MSSFLEWKQEYSVEISVVDAQHKQVFSLINELFAAITEQDTDAHFGKIFLKLRLFMETHLRCEEVYLKYANYPHCEAHRKLHIGMTGEVNRLIDSLEKGKDSPQELLLFLKKWWQNHVCEEDSKYIEHTNKLPL